MVDGSVESAADYRVSTTQSPRDVFNRIRKRRWLATGTGGVAGEAVGFGRGDFPR